MKSRKKLLNPQTLFNVISSFTLILYGITMSILNETSIFLLASVGFFWVFGFAS
jgi:hypothetical protein